MTGIKGHISVPVNLDNWLLLFQVLGHKIIARCSYQPKVNNKRKSAERSGHRGFEIELDTAVMVRTKLLDIADFDKKIKGII